MTPDAAFALGGEDGHLTVSLDNLRDLSLNGTSVTFGGGNHLGDVALYLWENGEHSRPSPERLPSISILWELSVFAA